MDNIYNNDMMGSSVGLRSFGDLIELVRIGYQKAAVPYNEQKDTSVLNNQFIVTGSV